MSQRDIFSILEDGQPFKFEQKTLRKDRKGIRKEPKVVVKRVKKKEEETVVNPETNFVSD